MKNSHFAVKAMWGILSLAFIFLIVGCPPQDKDKDLAIKSGELGLVIDLAQKSLTVSFNKKITEVDKTKIKVKEWANAKATKSTAVTPASVAVNVDGKLYIVLSDITASKLYSVEVDKGGVKAGSKTFKAKKDTEKDTVIAFVSGVSYSNSDKKVTITFDTNAVASADTAVKTSLISTNSKDIEVASADFTTKKVLDVVFKEVLPTGKGVVLTFKKDFLKKGSEPFTVEYDKRGPVWNGITPVIDAQRKIKIDFAEIISAGAAAEPYVLYKGYKGKTEKGDKISSSDITVEAPSDTTMQTIILKAGFEFTDTDTFGIEVAQDAVQDSNGNSNEAFTISGIKKVGKSTPEPAAVSALGGQSNDGAPVQKNANEIHVTLKKTITAIDTLKVKIKVGSNRATRTGITSSVLDQNNKANVIVTLDSPNDGADLAVVFEIGALTDGTKKNEAKLTTAAVSIDATKPALGTSNPNAVWDSSSRKITVTFNEGLGGVDESGKIKIKIGSTSKTTSGIEGAPVINQNNKAKVEVELDSTVSNGASVVVVFESGAVKDAVGNSNSDELVSGSITVS